MSEETEIISATEASRSFSELLHRVCYGGESFVIKKGNRLMAHIGPVTAKAAPPPEETAAANPAPAQLTQTDAEYYEAVIAQIRQAVPEACD